MMECKVKDNRINVLKAKNAELEKAMSDIVSEIADAKKKGRALEQMKTLMEKRDGQLTAKIKECDKKQGQVDQKDAEIGKLRRQIRIGGGGKGGGSGDDEVVVLEMREEIKQMGGKMGGMERELELLRSMVGDKVGNLGGEGGEDVVGSVGRKLQDMQAEIGKIQQIVHEGEKYKNFLTSLKELGIEASSYELKHQILGGEELGGEGPSSPSDFFAGGFGDGEDSISSVESGEADSPTHGGGAGGGGGGGGGFVNWDSAYDDADGDSDEVVISPRGTFTLPAVLGGGGVVHTSPAGSPREQVREQKVKEQAKPTAILRKSSFTLDPKTDAYKGLLGAERKKLKVDTGSGGEEGEEKKGSPRKSSREGTGKIGFRDMEGAGSLVEIATIAQDGKSILFSRERKKAGGGEAEAPSAPKITAVSTPTRFIVKKPVLPELVEGEGRGGGGGGGGGGDALKSPSKPTEMSVLEHKKKVRALVFGLRASNALK